MSDSAAWLEDHAGKQWPVEATCALGRASSNDIVVDNGKVSRRHALIHRQDAAEHWVIDLGSGNGTYVNGRRLALPTRLANGDKLMLGEVEYVFRQRTGAPVAVRPARKGDSGIQTLIDIRSMPCWLLVADIKGSTALAARLPPTEMAMMTGRWMSACKEAIERHDGIINKYLGDGFFAYWYADRDRTNEITSAMGELVALQRDRHNPPFRLALHWGDVTVGGGGAAGEDSLSGRDVSLAFRMEELAGKLGCDVLLSEAARARIGAGVKVTDAGVHPLVGYENDRLRFFVMA